MNTVTTLAGVTPRAQGLTTIFQKYVRYIPGYEAAELQTRGRLKKWLLNPLLSGRNIAAQRGGAASMPLHTRRHGRGGCRGMPPPQVPVPGGGDPCR